MDCDSSELCCDLTLHNGLQEMGELICPFCKFQFNFIKQSEYDLLCCDEQDIINDNNEKVCKNCGIVHGYQSSKNMSIFMKIDIVL